MRLMMSQSVPPRLAPHPKCLLLWVCIVCFLLQSIFCPDGYTCGNVQKPAILCVCILHSDDQILTVNSYTQNCWNRLGAVPLLPLTVPYITLQRSCPVVTGSWMKSPIKSMDMPPNVWSGLYIDWSLVSNRTRNCALNMETSSTTTILNFISPGQLFKDFTSNKSVSCSSTCMQ